VPLDAAIAKYSAARSAPEVDAEWTKLNAPDSPSTEPSNDSRAMYVPTPVAWSKAEVKMA
jgi:hypothetical protein